MTTGSSEIPPWAKIDYQFYFVSEDNDRAVVGDKGAKTLLSRDELKARAIDCRDKLAARFKKKFRTMTAEEVEAFLEEKAQNL
jgi:hypothetical protein